MWPSNAPVCGQAADCGDFSVAAAPPDPRHAAIDDESKFVPSTALGPGDRVMANSDGETVEKVAQVAVSDGEYVGQYFLRVDRSAFQALTPL